MTPRGWGRRTLRLLYLLAQHPWHLQRALIDRGLVLGWLRLFAAFWDTVRPPGVPVTDFASFQALAYHYAARFRERHPAGDRFEDLDAARSRLFGYTLRRERHPLRWLRAAWHLRRCRTVLEFGAGAAPYAHGVATAWPLRRPAVWIVDLPGLLLAQARWTFQGHEALGWRVLEAGAPLPAATVDGVVCTEVFEHLQDPVGTAEWLMALAPRLAFDYVDDGSPQRRDTLAHLAAGGRLQGPDRRGLYRWTRHPQVPQPAAVNVMALR